MKPLTKRAPPPVPKHARRPPRAHSATMLPAIQLPTAAECSAHAPDRYVVRPAGVLAELLVEESEIGYAI